MKTKEQIAAYNKEYFARPEVIARAKIRNAKYRDRRRGYKKTRKGRIAEKCYSSKLSTRTLKEWSRIKSRYGLTKDEFENMLAQQNGCCAICGEVSRGRLHIDHCHSTGRVRGLLCGNCNMALGLMRDNTEFLLKAIKYLNNV